MFPLRRRASSPAPPSPDAPPCEIMDAVALHVPCRPRLPPSSPHYPAAPRRSSQAGRDNPLSMETKSITPTSSSTTSSTTPSSSFSTPSSSAMLSSSAGTTASPHHLPRDAHDARGTPDSPGAWHDCEPSSHSSRRARPAGHGDLMDAETRWTRDLIDAETWELCALVRCSQYRHGAAEADGRGDPMYFKELPG